MHIVSETIIYFGMPKNYYTLISSYKYFFLFTIAQYHGGDNYRVEIKFFLREVG